MVFRRMQPRWVAGLLGETQLLGRLDAAALQELAARSKRRSYRRGEVIFRQEDPSGLLFMLVTGLLKVAVRSVAGGQLILAVLDQPGAVVGEVGLVDGRPHEASCEALEDSEVLLLAREDLMPLLQSSAEVAQGLLLTMAARVRQSVEHSSDLTFLSLPGRLAKALLSLSQYQEEGSDRTPLRLTQTVLAERVGGSRVSVNQTLRMFESRGWLRNDHGRITLLDPHALEEFAR